MDTAQTIEKAQELIEQLLAQDTVSAEFTAGAISGLMIAAVEVPEARQEFINAFFYTQANRATAEYNKVRELSQHVITVLGITPEELSAAEVAITSGDGDSSKVQE